MTYAIFFNFSWRFTSSSFSEGWSFFLGGEIPLPGQEFRLDLTIDC